MVAGSAFIIVLILLVAVVVLVVVGALAYRRQGSRAASVPLCGRCGYQLAPNPAGLSVCPECGGNFLSVGILAPDMKLGRRGSPAVPLGIAWFVLVGLGMLPVHAQLVKTFTRTLTTGIVNQTSSGIGPINSIAVVAKREQLAGEKAPLTLEADVTLTGPAGKKIEFTVDAASNTLAAAPTMPAAVGSAWSDDAAAKLIAAVAEGEPDPELTKRVRSVVDDAITKSAGGGTFGGVSSFSSTSTSSGLSFGTRRRGFTETASSSSYTGNVTPVVLIGSLRGAHWVVLMSGMLGLAIAFFGLWLVVRLTREKRAA
ncbi:MAG: hypothetical protein Q8L55_13675 [Phycisphaerales bacterium]|nr:hypothetical protein [Phycisphaerales bacterium]